MATEEEGPYRFSIDIEPEDTPHNIRFSITQNMEEIFMDKIAPLFEVELMAGERIEEDGWITYLFHIEDKEKLRNLKKWGHDMMFPDTDDFSKN